MREEMAALAAHGHVRHARAGGIASSASRRSWPTSPRRWAAVCRVETGQAAGVEGEIVGFKAEKDAGDALRRHAGPQPRRPRALRRRLPEHHGGQPPARTRRRRPHAAHRRQGRDLGRGATPIFRRAPHPPIAGASSTEPLGTGVRAIDGLLTIGRGQRMGIFSGAGVGKSVLLGMIARYTARRRQRHRAGRRARPRGERVPRARPRRGRARALASSSWPPATSRRWCA